MSDRDKICLTYSESKGGGDSNDSSDGSVERSNGTQLEFDSSGGGCSHSESDGLGLGVEQVGELGGEQGSEGDSGSRVARKTNNARDRLSLTGGDEVELV